jgi:predicted tellurium resistance membrane protein TerC
MEIFLLAETWISLLTLTFLEIVLGIDNIIFISIVADKLPKVSQAKARNIGLILAIVIRIFLLMGISYIVHLTEPLFTVFDFAISVRDLILIAGGLFLLTKSTTEIHHKVSGDEQEAALGDKKQMTVKGAIFQIVLLDIVFSFDSILTAVGLSDHLPVMIAAVLISLGVMLVFAAKIAAFINEQPTIQMLALSFLIMIGTLLILDGFHVHVPKGYIYFSLVFSLLVEFLNQRMRKRRESKK